MQLEVVLWGEVSLESLPVIRDSVEVEQGLSVLIFSGVPGVGGAGQVPVGNMGAWETHRLGELGEGLLREVRCCKSCLTHVWGEAELAPGWGIGQEGCRGLRIWLPGSEDHLGVERIDFLGWGDCFKGRVRLWDVDLDGLWCFGWGFGCRLGKVEMDGPGMLSCPVIAFALGLYDVATWCSSLDNDCAGDVLMFCRKQEQHFLAWL